MCCTSVQSCDHSGGVPVQWHGHSCALNYHSIHGLANHNYYAFADIGNFIIMYSVATLCYLYKPCKRQSTPVLWHKNGLTLPVKASCNCISKNDRGIYFVYSIDNYTCISTSINLIWELVHSEAEPFNYMNIQLLKVCKHTGLNFIANDAVFPAAISRSSGTTWKLSVSAVTQTHTKTPAVWLVIFTSCNVSVTWKSKIIVESTTAQWELTIIVQYMHRTDPGFWGLFGWAVAKPQHVSVCAHVRAAGLQQVRRDGGYVSCTCTMSARIKVQYKHSYAQLF